MPLMGEHRCERNPDAGRPGQLVGRDSDRLQIWLIAAMLGLVGGTALWLATRWGIGLSPDSVVYAEAAANLNQGRGLVTLAPDGGAQSLTHYPPLFPWLLSPLAGRGGLLGLLSCARWLQLVVYLVNVWLLTWMLSRLTGRDKGAVTVGVALAVLCVTPTLTTHSQLWTEPLFVALTLGCLLTGASFLKTGSWWLGLTTAVLAALACLTRYAGVALLVTCWVALLTRRPRPSWRREIAFLVVSGGPVIALLLWNRGVAGSATNRSLAWHPPGLAHWQQAAASYTLRFVLVGLLTLFLAAAATRLMAGVSAAQLRRRVMAAQLQPGLGRLLWLYLVTYSLFLGLALTFFDAHMPIDDRILAPIFPVAVALLAPPLRSLLDMVRDRALLRWVLLLLPLLLLGTQLVGLVRWTRLSHDAGIEGYTSRAWQESALIAWIRQAPESLLVYSNAPDALRATLARPAWWIPRHTETSTRAPNSTYAAELSAMSSRLRGGAGVIVYFRAINRSYLPTPEELQRQLPLRLLYETEAGAVYAVLGGE